MSKWQFYRSRKKAMNKIQGSVHEQYTMLWDYCEALKESNPDTTVKTKLSQEAENPQFQRLYICFAACKTGWLARCRRVIGLDGCHVKAHMMENCWLQLGLMVTIRCIPWRMLLLGSSAPPLGRGS